MKKITLLLLSAAFTLSAATVFAMDGRADRFHESTSYPHKASDTITQTK